MENTKTFANADVNSMSVIDAAKTYIAHGLAVVPDKPKSKQPAITNWVNAKIGLDDVNCKFQADSNVSILLGKASGGCVCVDIDHSLALSLSEYLIPTTCVHGRQGMPGSHHWYVIDGGTAPTVQFKHPNGLVLAEILGDKRKITSPPSTHESGEKITWESEGAPTHTLYVAVKGATGLMCAATLLAMEWPHKGSRNQAGLALSGLLLKSGMEREAVEIFVGRVAKAAKDEEWQARVDCVKATEAKLAQGEPVTGAKRLGELIGADIVERVNQWLNLKAVSGVADSLTLDGDLTAMNDRHAVIQLGGSAAILNEDYDPVFERKGVSFSKPADLRLRYQHKQHVVIDSISGKPRKRSLADIWFEYPGRRQYAGVEFNPVGTTPGFWNRYRGFAVAPKEGDCSLYMKHVEEVICHGNKQHFDYVIRWMAHAVQKPAERPETALVLRGKQGTGKGMFVELFGALFGEHYFTVYKHEQITGKFNAHLMNVILLHLNEALWGGHKGAAGTLKGLITDPSIPIEPKGKDIFAVRNYTRVIVSSNESWAVPVDMDDRRFLVLDVSGDHKEDHTYFAKISEQMRTQGGCGALMHLLQAMDLSNFEVRKVPVSAHVIDLKLQSAEPVVQWWFQRLKEGHAETWPLQAEKEMLHGDYLDWCKALKMQHPLSLELFGRAMKKLVPTLTSFKPTKTTMMGPVRISCFKFPSLAPCRKYMEEAMKADEQIWT